MLRSKLHDVVRLSAFPTYRFSTASPRLSTTSHLPRKAPPSRRGSSSKREMPYSEMLLLSFIFAISLQQFLEKYNSDERFRKRAQAIARSSNAQINHFLWLTGNTIFDFFYPRETLPEKAPSLLDQTPKPLSPIKLKSAFSKSNAKPSNYALGNEIEASLATRDYAKDA